MIRHWCEAMGDTNPVYTDPAAAQASVHGEHRRPADDAPGVGDGAVSRVPSRGGDGPYERLTETLYEHGFTSVVATNCEQTYVRVPAARRHGDDAHGDRRRQPGEDDRPRHRPLRHHAAGLLRRATTNWSARCSSASSASDPPDREPARAASTSSVRPPTPGDDARQPVVVRGAAGWGVAGAALPAPAAPCAIRPVRCALAARASSGSAIDAGPAGRVHSFVRVHHPQVPSFDYPLAVAPRRRRGTPVPSVPVRMLMNPLDPRCHLRHRAIRCTIEIRAVDDDLSLPFAVAEPTRAERTVNFDLSEEQQVVADLAGRLFDRPGDPRAGTRRRARRRLRSRPVGDRSPTPTCSACAFPSRGAGVGSARSNWR